MTEEIQLQPSIRENGRFKNPWKTWRQPSAGGLCKFMCGKDNSNIPSKRELDKTLPILPLDHEVLKEPPSSGIRYTWIGHASCLVQMDNITFITDPMFSQRASPISFMGPKRYRDPPCKVSELPKIDAVVISHNHYDHLDYTTVLELNKKFGAKLKWFVPMGQAAWMKDCGCENVSELDWWEEDSHSEFPNVKFAFAPVQHWSKRTLGDDNKALWGSWVVIGPTKKFYFTGDTGYCEAFKQIGHKYGPIDVAAIPIGAYEPNEFLRWQHVNPDEAVLIHQDLNAKKSVGIHWGTFKMLLTFEFYLEPRERLKEVLHDKDLSQDEFITVSHGETKLFE